MTDSRRRFIKLALLSGCMAPCLGKVSFAGEEQDECEAKLAKLRSGYENYMASENLARIKALAERFGPELIEATREHTIESARKRFASRDLESRDLSAVKKLLWDNLDDKFEFSLVKETPKYLEYKVTRCYLAEMANRMDAADAGFALNCAWDYGFCKGLNPDIKFTRTKTLMQGHDCCNHTYKLKKA